MLRRPRRALAPTALVALALAVSPLAPTPAASADDPPSVVLLSQLSGNATTSPDGYDAAITLAARRSDPTAEVSFQYNLDPEAGAESTGWVSIPGRPTETGPFATVLWDGTAWDGSDLAGRTIGLRATALGGGILAASAPARVRVQYVTGYSFVPVALRRDTTTGYFPAAYREDTNGPSSLAVVSGEVVRPDTVTVSRLAADGSRVDSRDLSVDPNPGSDFPRFHTAFDLRDLDPQTGDPIAFAAVTDADDVQVSTLYRQRLGTVRVEQSPSYGGPSPIVGVVVRVADAQEGAPVAGVEVRRGSTGELVGYTDARGRVSSSLRSGVTESWYANATDVAGFDAAAGDVTSGPQTFRTYDPDPRYVDPSLADGPLFDVDEFTAGDVGLEVRDQLGQLIDRPAGVAFRFYTVGVQAPGGFQLAQTVGSTGRAPLPVDPGNSPQEFALDYRLGSDPTVGGGEFRTERIRIGEATLTLTPTAPVRAAAGGQVELTGRLAIGGTGLPGRTITLRWVRGYEVVPGDAPDAGIVVGDARVLTHQVVTDADGRFTVTVADRVEPHGAGELGGLLATATGARTETSRTVEFGSLRPGRLSLRLSGRSNGARADVLRVDGPVAAAGELVNVFRYSPEPLSVVTRRLDSRGDLPRVVVRDLNRDGATHFIVRVVPSDRASGGTSNLHRVR